MSQAYSAGTVTPVQVVRNILYHIGESERSSPAMRYLVSYDIAEILTQAKLSAVRCGQFTLEYPG